MYKLHPVYVYTVYGKKFKGKTFAVGIENECLRVVVIMRLVNIHSRLKNHADSTNKNLLRKDKQLIV